MAGTGSRGVQLFGIAALVMAAVAAACGSGNKGYGAPGADGGGGGSDGAAAGDAADGGSLIGSGTVKSLALSPPTATITSTNGAPATQPYTLNATYTDGSVSPVSANVTWTSDAPVVGAIGSTGVYTARRRRSAASSTCRPRTWARTRTATLTVKLLVQQNRGNVRAAHVQTALQGATTPDASVVWAYPYDGTVWPRGLLPPTLQWNGGAATDAYYVHVKSPTFELKDFTTATGAPASQLSRSTPTTWQSSPTRPQARRR